MHAPALTRPYPILIYDTTGMKYFITAITLSEEKIRKQDLDLEPVAKVIYDLMDWVIDRSID